MEYIYLLLSFFYTCRLNDEEVRLMLWDTAGQEEFDAITKSYYRGKTHIATYHVFIIVFY